ncbi:type 1 glutamine amidotransferase domain-containing protein [uncultured Proteiniphilum sp.]|uniref:type 1 glutamine amidotransferase domain-containing protein n=1 Tax=uncultured Proteiniphilum sp. TaxID=497637 RepID=UPI0026223613|nr:type 1 glutamine amidotransferase domain-containing protein [uncultured Proteiniphilum sp.]
MLSIVLFAAGCSGSGSGERSVSGESRPEAAGPDIMLSGNCPQVAVLLTEGFQDAEAYMPIGYLENKDIDITVIGPKTGRVKAYNSDFEIVVQKTVGEVSIDEFDALILPGGKAPAVLREDPTVVAFAKNFFHTGKPVAAICHGPQVLATAGVLQEVTTTGVGSIREELEDAGANYVDEALVIDGNLITSRVPDDLPVFSKAIEEAIKKAR